MRKLISLFYALLFACLPAMADGPFTGFFPDPSVSGDPNATYLQLSTSTVNVNERVLSPTARFTVTDNGPGMTYVLELATVGVAYGGSGATTAQGAINTFADGAAGAAAATGDMLYRAGGGTWTRLPIGSAGQFMQVSGGIPAWGASASGAPAGASYLTLGLDAGLSAERVLTAGDGIGFADTGANGTLTIAVDSTVVRTTGAQSVGGVKTFTDSPAIANTKVLTLKGAAFDISIDGADVAAARTYSIIDTGTATADFIMSEGAQTKAGVLTLSAAPVLSTGTVTVGGNTITFPSTAQTLVGRTSTDTLTNKTLTAPILTSASTITLTQSTANYTIDWANPSGARAYTIRDVGADAHFAMTGTAVTYTDGGIVFTDGNVMKVTGAGTSGQAFISQGTSDPVFGTLGISGGGTNNASLGVSAVGIYNGDGSKVVQTTGTALQSWRVNAGATAVEAFTPGTVTSFSATPSGIFDVATATSTPALSLDNQSANVVLAGPTTGGAATPSFRALVAADMPAGFGAGFGGDGSDGAINDPSDDTAAAPKQVNATTWVYDVNGGTYDLQTANTTGGPVIINCTSTFTVGDGANASTITVAAGSGSQGGKGGPALSGLQLQGGNGSGPGGGTFHATSSAQTYGGGGGGFGASGGNGGCGVSALTTSNGGTPYSYWLLGGSGGGGGGNDGTGGTAGGAGGNGGGSLIVCAAGAIDCKALSVINALGQAGATPGTGGSGGGGGSGGMVFLASRTSVTVAGTINVTGGAGGNGAGSSQAGGGGGGGAGRILCWSPSNSTGSATFTMTGGAAGTAGGTGNAGTAGSNGTQQSITGTPNLPILAYFFSPEGGRYFDAICQLQEATGRKAEIKQSDIAWGAAKNNVVEFAYYNMGDENNTTCLMVGDYLEGLANAA